MHITYTCHTWQEKIYKNLFFRRDDHLVVNRALQVIFESKKKKMISTIAYGYCCAVVFWFTRLFYTPFLKQYCKNERWHYDDIQVRRRTVKTSCFTGGLLVWSILSLADQHITTTGCGLGILSEQALRRELTDKRINI